MRRRRALQATGLLGVEWWLPRGVRAEEALPPVSWARAPAQPDAWFASPAATRMAERVLAAQRANGGWPKNLRYLEPEPLVSPADRGLTDTTLDNGATTRELRFLARWRMIERAGGERATAAVLDGLDWLLAAQYPNGGWPQYFPLRADYSRHVTFNDRAIVAAVELLRDVATGAEPFAFVDRDRRARAREAVARGLALILAAQVRVDGRLTAWAAQHHVETLQPAPARSYEPVALASKESAEILELLLEVEPPSAALEQAVEAGVAWLRAVRLGGQVAVLVAAPDLPGGRDRVVKPVPGAPGAWARFYEIGTNRPLYLGRDGVARATLAEVEHERRAGYAWVGDWPARLVDEAHPRWRARTLRTR